MIHFIVDVACIGLGVYFAVKGRKLAVAAEAQIAGAKAAAKADTAALVSKVVGEAKASGLPVVQIFDKIEKDIKAGL